MERPSNGITKRRTFALVLLILFIFAGFSIRLFQVQIVEGKAYAQLASKSSATQVPIAASRGEILDRYMRPMVVNRTSFSILFDYAFFPNVKSEKDNQKANDMILSLTDLLTSKGGTWNETIPISKTAPYSFSENREKSINALKTKYRMADSATADQCIAALAEQFKLTGYTSEQQRTIIGVRYEMDLRDFGMKNPFTFSTDISKDTYNIILENNTKYPGVTVETTPVREYVNSTVAPHLMGTVGPIYAEEYADLKDRGYLLSDTLGKDGIEAAMESSLRGTNGASTIYKDSNGVVVEKRVTTPPVPGSSVILSLDSQLEQTAQNTLDAAIKELRSQSGDGHDVRSGSIVMIDVKTGGVLVSASWPNYDLKTYKQTYNELIKDPDNPLLNRALQGAYPCGSTMKPCIALAGLNEGIIAPSTRLISCHHNYTQYASGGLVLHCMGYHGSIDVVQALSKSCNIYFYELGRIMGIEKMNYYSAQFGLGQKTGIEIGERAGVLAGPAVRKGNGQSWYPADTSQAAIGQSDNLFTPIQLATYTSALANDGVRYKTHLVKSIRHYDGTETVVQPEVAASVQLSQQAIDTVRQGMITVTQNGTASSQFRGCEYTVAAKTGTAQVSNTRSDHGVFIAYAPAEKPEVAIAVVLEDGTSRPSTRVGRTMLDAYFASKQAGAAPTPEGQLLP